MFEAISYTLPFIVCLLWLFIYLFRKKNSSQKFYLAILAVAVVYFYTYALYISPNTDYKLMVRLDVFCQPLALVLLTLVLLYVESHLERPVIPTFIKTIFCLVPILHLGFVSFIYYLLSFDGAAMLTEAYDKAVSVGVKDPFEIMPDVLTGRIQRLYMFFDIVIFSGICAFYSICIMAMCVYSSIVNRDTIKVIPRFFTNSDFSGMVHLVNFSIIMVLLSVGPLISMGRSYIFNNPTLGLCMSLALSFFIFLASYVEFVGDGFFRKDDIKQHIGVISEEVNAGDTQEPNGTDKLAQGVLPDFGKTSLSAVQGQESVAFNENIDRTFIHSMEVDRIYTDSTLTIDSLAKKLRTNRSTLSALINKKYGMTFKTMLASYRIAFAKQYMLDNPNASVDDVAEVSGFGDRSTFFHKFKEVTGMSPKVWLTKQ